MNNSNEKYINNPDSIFAQRLTELIGDQKIKEIADFLHISRQTLSNLKNGKNEPDIKTLVSLAMYFDVSLEYLLGLTDDKSIDQENNLKIESTGLNSESIKKLILIEQFNLSKETINKVICDPFFLIMILSLNRMTKESEFIINHSDNWSTHDLQKYIAHTIEMPKYYLIKNFMKFLKKFDCRYDEKKFKKIEENAQKHDDLKTHHDRIHKELGIARRIYIDKDDIKTDAYIIEESDQLYFDGEEWLVDSDPKKWKDYEDYDLIFLNDDMYF